MAAILRLVVLLLWSCSQVLRVAALNLAISPEHARVPTTSLTSLTVMCNADVSLTGCQFTWINKDKTVGPILELRRGQHSSAHPAHITSALKGYNYTGRGLAAGDCGVKLHIAGFKIWMIGCRVQERGGSWSYAWMDLFADSWHNPPSTVTPREVVVLPGGEARIEVKSTAPLTECRFSLPGAPSTTLFFDNSTVSTNSTDRHTYLGGGLGGGECGLLLTNVSEVDNGPVTCKIRKVTPNEDDYRFIPLVVAKPPGAAPALSVTQKGAEVSATCMVGKSRPVANITWLLGDDVIRQDDVDDAPGDVNAEWRWPWTPGSISQKVSLQLQPEDNGKVLECVVSHVALAQPLDAHHKMLFTEKSSTEVQAQEATQIATEIAKANLEAVRFNARTEEAKAREEEAKAKAAELGVEAASYTAKATKEAAEIAAEMAKANLEAARSSARAEEARAKAADIALEAARSSARAEEARAREVEAKAKAAELAIEAANSTAWAAKEAAVVAMEVSRSSARAEEARAKNEEARAREEEAWAKNAEEELQFERERRSQSKH